jgi:hypothetical protein
LQWRRKQCVITSVSRMMRSHQPGPTKAGTLEQVSSPAEPRLKATRSNTESRDQCFPSTQEC